MLQLLLGAVIGVIGTLTYSEQVRLKCMQTNIEILQIIKNKAELRREVYKEIQKMQASGELEDYLSNGKQYFPISPMTIKK